MGESRTQDRKQPCKITPTELAQRICRLLRVEGMTAIELSLLRNGAVLVSKIPDSAKDLEPRRVVRI
jgi:hypothetical protein